VLRQNRRSDADEDVRQVSNALLVECERAKERLSFQERADVSLVHPHTGAVLAAEFTRSRFEDLLDEHEAFTRIDQTVRRALNETRERGYGEDDVKAVLMVGGSSQIPSVQRTLRRIFGRERVMLNRPLDAVARGAAAFVTGVDFYDHIQHDYAIRYLDREKGKHEYRVIVRRGTPYPTTEPVARLTVKASYDGQTQLGINIFEIGERGRRGGGQPVEIVWDPSGAARVMQVTPDEEDRRTYFWMNEGNPTFLTADPPARQGEGRFAVEFNIDGNKRLLITTRDLQTGQTTHRDYPVVKLT
jgi:molecular chaperone DnaK